MSADKKTREKILEVLKRDYDIGKIRIHPDPKVSNVFAVRNTLNGENIDFLVNLNDEGVDELEFTKWPPVSGELKFFI